MAIDKVNGSHALQSANYNSTSRLELERSTMAQEITKEVERTTLQKSETDEMIKKQDVEDAIDKLNSFMDPVRRNLKFELHDKLDKYYVTVIDSSTDEVIKEIPPKKILDMYAAMAEFMGILVDKKI